jgi:hypothetical protein
VSSIPRRFTFGTRQSQFRKDAPPIIHYFARSFLVIEGRKSESDDASLTAAFLALSVTTRRGKTFSLHRSARYFSQKNATVK